MNATCIWPIAKAEELLDVMNLKASLPEELLDAMVSLKTAIRVSKQPVAARYGTKEEWDALISGACYTIIELCKTYNIEFDAYVKDFTFVDGQALPVEEIQ